MTGLLARRRPTGLGGWLARSRTRVVAALILVAAAAPAVPLAAAAGAAESTEALVCWYSAAVQLAGSLAVLLRPRAVAAATLAAAVAVLLPIWTGEMGETAGYFGGINPWPPLAILIASGMATRQGGRGTDVLVAWGVIGVAVLAAVRVWEPSTSTVVSGVLRTVLPGLLGAFLATRERLVAALREQARRVESDHRRALASARQAERTRLADEMHDLVTHRVSLMVLAADALRRAPDQERSRATARVVREHGVAALDELRELLGLLHADQVRHSGPDTAFDHSGHPAADDVVARSAVEPRPRAGGVAPDPDVEDLIAAAESAGTSVRFDRDGEPRAVPLAVRRAVARVVQEALTNTRKHAAGAAVRVELRYDSDRVRVEIRTAAPGRTAVATAPDHLAAAGTPRLAEPDRRGPGDAEAAGAAERGAGEHSACESLGAAAAGRDTAVGSSDAEWAEVGCSGVEQTRVEGGVRPGVEEADASPAGTGRAEVEPGDAGRAGVGSSGAEPGAVEVSSGGSAGADHNGAGRACAGQAVAEPTGAQHAEARLAGTGSGRGLAALRHRVGLLGGTLRAGRLPDGGFRVSATLPTAGSATPGGSEPPAESRSSIPLRPERGSPWTSCTAPGGSQDEVLVTDDNAADRRLPHATGQQGAPTGSRVVG
ncbi:histidine kinase [Actinoalloteichus sp. GBA129-24]|uniref:histidine kinase n=1 Tax=Actinoalloteichus sp. GBA129-24 TaxID=1612551 RepID=UPI00095099DE|nr:Histidine kinase [Actinoalloteichus sp. GBA129-24]